MPGNVSSWGKVLSMLWRLNRLKVFDRYGEKVKFLNHPELLKSGKVSVVDLSDAGMTELSNIAIAVRRNPTMAAIAANNVVDWSFGAVATASACNSSSTRFA